VTRLAREGVEALGDGDLLALVLDGDGLRTGAIAADLLEEAAYLKPVGNTPTGQSRR